MTTPDLPAGRTIPDTDDLRLLAELINNEYIPLANAAWNAQMTQQEAATRLVQMAERGMPLRLVADGDRRALWQIAQAGPATGAVAAPDAGAPVQETPAVVPVPATPEVPSAPPLPFTASPPLAVAPEVPAAADVPVPVVAPAVPEVPYDAPVPPPVAAQIGSPVPPPVSAPIGSPVPPPAPVPPHEQAIAGAVPFGQPPFGPPPVEQPPVEQPPVEQPPAEPAPEAVEPATPAEPEPPAYAAPLSDPDATQVASFADFDQSRAAGPAAAAAAAAGVAAMPSAAEETMVYRPDDTADRAASSALPADAGSEAPADSGPAETPPTDGGPAEAGPAEAGPAEAGPAEGGPAEADAAQGDMAVGLEGGRHASADSASTWGVPGTSSWARGDAPPEAAADAPPDATSGAVPAVEPTVERDQPVPAYQPPPPAYEPPPAAYQPPVAEPPAPVYEPPAPRTWATRPVVGPGGEQLAVTVLDVLDPGDAVLTSAGYRMEPGQRAVLVNSSVANGGQVPYYPVGDLYLVLETASRQLLGRAAIAVGSHPAYPVGVMPGQTTRGWSVFLIPADTALSGIKWCIRPDLPQSILSWPIGGE